MSFIENKFAIRRISRATEEDYLVALRVYNETTPTEIKTNTNEISYWLSRKDENASFEAMIFVLYIDDDVAGLAMMSYVIAQKLVVIEYIALYERYRVNAVFFPFISLLQNYLSSENYDVAYMVNEISNKNQGKGIDKESRLFKKLICLEGFGKIEALYFTPPLGLNNHESSFDAFLYVKSNDNIAGIQRNTYQDMVRGIYYDYFLPWYAPFMSQEEHSAYKEKIDNCFEKIEKSSSEQMNCKVSYQDCPLLYGNDEERTFGSIPIKKKRKFHVVPLAIILVLSIPLLLIWVYNTALTALGIQMSSANSIIGAMFSATITASVTLWIARKRL